MLLLLAGAVASAGLSGCGAGKKTAQPVDGADVIVTEETAKGQDAAEEEIQDTMPTGETYVGTWAEQTSERVVLLVRPSSEPDWYDVWITWREDLPQKDVYTMRAHYLADGALYYEDGVHVLRTFAEDGTYTDEPQYTSGAGIFWYSAEEGLLRWTDYEEDSQDSVQSFIRADGLAVEPPEAPQVADTSPEADAAALPQNAP